MAHADRYYTDEFGVTHDLSQYPTVTRDLTAEREARYVQRQWERIATLEAQVAELQGVLTKVVNNLDIVVRLMNDRS